MALWDEQGDPTRREILQLLSHGDKAVHEIAAALPNSRPAGSRHLRLLKEVTHDARNDQIRSIPRNEQSR